MLLLMLLFMLLCTAAQVHSSSGLHPNVSHSIVAERFSKPSNCAVWQVESELAFMYNLEQSC